MDVRDIRAVVPRKSAVEMLYLLYEGFGGVSPANLELEKPKTGKGNHTGEQMGAEVARMRMRPEKYYSYKHSRLLDFERDGCSLEDWRKPQTKALFAEHPKGFPIFLPSDELAACDEYSDSDPYTVEQNIDGDFHNRRVNLTVNLLREALNYAGGKPRVLDLGCGQGHITEQMRIAFPEAELSGLDYSLSAIEYAHDHFPGIDFSVGNAYCAPYVEGYFDVVVCNNLWEHVADPLLLLKRISTILKSDGFLIISTPSRYRLANLLRILQGKPVTLMSKHHVTEYSVGQVIEQLSYGEFRVTKIASKPIKLNKFKAEMARQIISIVIKLVGSHHQLEATVFYLARKLSRDV